MTRSHAQADAHPVRGPISGRFLCAVSGLRAQDCHVPIDAPLLQVERGAAACRVATDVVTSVFKSLILKKRPVHFHAAQCVVTLSRFHRASAIGT